MPNAIVTQTQSFLSKLGRESPQVLEAAHASARAHSTTTYGVELSVEEELYLAIAVKFVAAVDGLSPLEHSGLRRMVQRYDTPKEIVDFVHTFDVSELAFEAVAELFEQGSEKAKRVLSGAVLVACLDGGDEGMSATERELAVQIAERLGLNPVLVEVYEARAQLELLVLVREDEELGEAATRLRHALWKLA